MIYLTFFCNIVIGQRDIPTDNLSYPALIIFKNGSSGSGFFLADSLNLYLVTAKHVLFKLQTGKLRGDSATVLKYSITDSTEGEFRFELDLNSLLSGNNLRYHKNQDMALIYFASILNRNNEQKRELNFVPGIRIKDKSDIPFIGASISNLKKFDKVLVANEVIIFGYPSSIGIKNIPQIEYNRPLLRKGIVAGINRKTKTLILDCPSYPGNSGGPVLEIERNHSLGTINFKIIGIVSEYIPFLKKQTYQIQGLFSVDTSNSGYSVATPIDSLFTLLNN